MPRRHYHKLVRDRIPETIRQRGSTFAVETLEDGKAFPRALRDKLVEEASES